MPKKLDPKIGEVLKKYGFGSDAVWDCHGTWVVYHRVLEQIAAANGIVFSLPQIIEADGGAKIAALAVEGELTGRKEWSIGEAAPGNNKNAYPWAMAEKRAKDRVILKLIGLHGLAYSEDEADDFKESAPKETPPRSRTVAEWKKEFAAIAGDMHDHIDYDGLFAYISALGGYMVSAQNGYVSVEPRAGLILEMSNEKSGWWDNDEGDVTGLKQRLEERLNQLKEQNQ